MALLREMNSSSYARGTGAEKEGELEQNLHHRHVFLDQAHMALETS